MNDLLISWSCRCLISSIISCKRSWVTGNPDIVNRVIYCAKAFSSGINNNWVDSWDLIINFLLINHYLNMIREMLKCFIIWFIFENSLRDSAARAFSIFASISAAFWLLTFLIMKIQEYECENLKLNFHFATFFISPPHTLMKNIII